MSWQLLLCAEVMPYLHSMEDCYCPLIPLSPRVYRCCIVTQMAVLAMVFLMGTQAAVLHSRNNFDERQTVKSFILVIYTTSKKNCTTTNSTAFLPWPKMHRQFIETLECICCTIFRLSVIILRSLGVTLALGFLLHKGKNVGFNRGGESVILLLADKLLHCKVAKRFLITAEFSILPREM